MLNSKGLNYKYYSACKPEKACYDLVCVFGGGYNSLLIGVSGLWVGLYHSMEFIQQNIKSLFVIKPQIFLGLSINQFVDFNLLLTNYSYTPTAKLLFNKVKLLSSGGTK